MGSGDKKSTQKEFKVMIIKMPNKLGRRVDEHREKFNKELENRRKIHIYNGILLSHKKE